MKTTLNAIRAHGLCADGWRKLLSYLGKTEADDKPLAITTILDSNGLDDALWCLRAVDGHDREIRLYAVWCVRQVQHLMTDPRSLAALDVAERHANGKATDTELSAAWDAARGAAWAAERDAAWAAEMDAERDAAWAAEMDAEMDAAWDAEIDAAWDAARGAAWAAAWAAAGAAARGAAWAAERAAAWDAARDAEREAQAARLREVCAEIDAREAGK